MFNIYIPTRNDYKEIIHLVNEADRVFCDIYTKSEANEVGVSNLTEEDLVSGEKTREYLVLSDGNEILKKQLIKNIWNSSKRWTKDFTELLLKQM